MPNDAKLGLVVGVGLVIAVAVLLFRRDAPAPPPPAAESAPAGMVQSPPHGSARPAPARPAASTAAP